MNTMQNAPETTLDVELFLASGDRLYQKQRTRMLANEAVRQQERFELMQTYAQRALALANERDDALRDLDHRHAKSREDGERMLAALLALREA